ncbi:AraC family transcriptional regulator [Vannielia litorea]|uniref:helix-turn-helix transcriptional regulator n=1 Tax=Vannielia litorea TaxID=1217970 RepID=UPI0028F735DF|nr:AraC family transcriptional regulator [Vannielia litorea]
MIRGPSFSLWRAPLRPAFRGLVRRITLYRSEGPLPGLMVEPAALVVPLIFVFDGRFEVGMGRDPASSDGIASFMAGLSVTPARIASPEAVQVLQIDLTPLGAMRLLGPALGETAEGVHALPDYGDRDISELHTRMGEADCWATRLALAESFLAHRLATTALPPALTRAWRIIEGTEGRAPIARIADHLGMTRRTLARQFRPFGLSPKAAARVARFTAASARAGTASWAEIAADAGYADQAHLTREFRALSGMTPQHFA